MIRFGYLESKISKFMIKINTNSYRKEINTINLGNYINIKIYIYYN